MIVKAGVETLKETLDKILGEGADVTLVRDIKKAIASNDKVHGAYDLILHNYGPDSYMGSVHIAVDDTLSINELDDVSREIHNDIMKQFNINLTAIGIYSVNTSDEEADRIKKTIEKAVVAHEYVNQMHGFYYNPIKKELSLDIVVSLSAKDRRKVHNEVIAELKEMYPEFNIRVGLDADFNEI